MKQENRGRWILKNKKGCISQDNRMKQNVESVYCDLTTKCVVTVLRGPQDTAYLTVPTGWSD